jgi:alpha-galactosidase
MSAAEIRVGDVALVLEPDATGRLRQIGWREGSIERGVFPAEAFPVAYPTWGDEGGAHTPALRVTHHDGVTSTRLRLDHWETTQIDTGAEHRAHLTDRDERLDVVLTYRTWGEEQLLEQWVEIRHDQGGPVVVHEVAAAAPAVIADDPWLTHYDGDWAAEWTTTEEPLTSGTKVLESYGGVRPHLQLSPFFLLSPGGRSSEDAASVLAGAVGWGGAVRMAFSRRHPLLDQVRVRCGHAPTGAAYTLDPGASFRTPSMYWAWSSSGRRTLSQRLHRFVRRHVVRDGDRVRATVLNNWEATVFDFDEDRLRALMDGGRKLGAELFLLDDGWFGDEYPRDSDDAGLGDWVPDPRKLPGGLGPLCDAAAERSLRFGLWIEPEMVNRASRLYREHPDWVVSQPVRERREERQQLVLDLCRPEVRDFAYETVAALLADNPGISYLKWDANRDVTEPGSDSLASSRQESFWVDTARARSQLMEDVARNHPGVEMMLCASGGGRTDLATLRHFHEVWLSDNTDAVTRVRMQWAASHFLPAGVVAAHVTRWGGQELGFASAVAMSARFGFDIDPDGLSPDEEAVCRRACAVYGAVRDIVQLGDLHRLVSPEQGDGTRAALMYVDPLSERAVVFAYRLETSDPGTTRAALDERLPLSGLDSSASYDVNVVDLHADPAIVPAEVWAGSDLLAEGLPWAVQAARSAAIWILSRRTR